jgi:hypothetical protein
MTTNVSLEALVVQARNAHARAAVASAAARLAYVEASTSGADASEGAALAREATALQTRASAALAAAEARLAEATAEAEQEERQRQRDAVVDAIRRLLASGSIAMTSGEIHGRIGGRRQRTHEALVMMSMRGEVVRVVEPGRRSHAYCLLAAPSA